MTRKKYTLICPKCGKHFTREISESEYRRNKYAKCCSSKCAHSREHSAENREQIRKSLQSHYVSKGYKYLPETVYLSKSNGKRKCLVKPGSNADRRQSTKKLLERTCSGCGKTIWVKNGSEHVYCYECSDQLNRKHIQLYSPAGKRVLSPACKKSIQLSASKRVAEGKHKGWTTRNTTSYPEQFWKKVLDNNNIKYHFNAPIAKSLLGLNEESNYFLDFLIGENIDLEIDGKQHKYTDRIESDKNRDTLLIKNGYYVYRVAWNEIASGEGAQLMRKKIERFLSWLNNTDKDKKYLQDYEIPTKYTYTCAVCGKEVKTNLKNRNKQFYCSKECSKRWREIS